MILLVVQLKNFDLKRPQKEEKARIFNAAILAACVIQGDFGDTKSYEVTYLVYP